MAQFEKITLPYHKILGYMIGFDYTKKVMTISDEEWTVEEWVRLRDRVDGVFRRMRVLPELQSPRSLGTNPFLMENIKQINQQNRGRIKRAPFILRWLYDCVVTKEELKENE